MLYYFSINVDRRIFVHFAVHFPRHVFILDKYILFENRRGNILGSELGERESIVITEQKTRTCMPTRVTVFSEHGK